MPSITIQKPDADDEEMPNPISGAFGISAIEFEKESLTDSTFVHLIITGTGPRGESCEVSGNAAVDEHAKTWTFDWMNSNVKLRSGYVYTITAQLILSTIYSDTKHNIRYTPTTRFHLKQTPHARKKGC